MDKALLIIDMQVDFVEKEGTEPILQSERDMIVENIKKVLAHAREKRYLVLHTQDTHDSVEASLKRGLKEHCVRNTPGWQFVKGVEPIEDEIVLEKEDYSAFVETDIEEILEKNKINYVYVVGVYTYLCVKANVIDLAKKHRVFVIEDCISSDDLDKSNKAKEYMKTMSEFIKAEKFLST